MKTSKMVLPVSVAIIALLQSMKKKPTMSTVTPAMRQGQRKQVKLVIDGNNYVTNYPNLPVIPIEWTYNTFADTIKTIRSKGFAPNMQKNIFAFIYAEAAKTADRKSFKGVNNNYAGVQTDSGVWGYNNFIAQAGIKDSGGRFRMFAVFSDFNEFIDFVHNRLIAKGFGSIDTADAWSPKYLTSWVGVPATSTAVASKKAIYNTAISIFNKTP